MNSRTDGGAYSGNVFVISLERSHLRRERIRRDLARRGIRFNFVSAVDGRLLSEAERLQLIWEPHRGWSNYFRAGAVGCALSHISVYWELSHSTEQGAIILEDDANPLCSNSDLHDLFEKFLVSEYDIWLIGSYSHRSVTMKSDRSVGILGRRLWRCSGIHPGGTIGYFIKSDAAKKIASFNTPLRCTADEFSVFSQELGLLVGAIKPDLVVPSFFGSDIDYDRSRNVLVRFTPEFVKKILRRMNYMTDQRRMFIFEQ